LRGWLPFLVALVDGVEESLSLFLSLFLFSLVGGCWVAGLLADVALFEVCFIAGIFGVRGDG
jgi:hypothetical protein